MYTHACDPVESLEAGPEFILES